MGETNPRENDQGKGNVPAASPDPAGNTGYAEPKPRNKDEAGIPGAKEVPDSEDGGLEHDPDQQT